MMRLLPYKLYGTVQGAPGWGVLLVIGISNEGIPYVLPLAPRHQPRARTSATAQVMQWDEGTAARVGKLVIHDSLSDAESAVQYYRRCAERLVELAEQITADAAGAP